MNAFALLSLLSSTLTLLLGGFIFLRDTRNPLNRVFMALCLALALWAFVEFGFRQAESIETARIWQGAASIGFMVAPLAVHFVLVFTGEYRLFRSQFTYLFLYIPAFMFSILGMTTDMMGGELVREFWGWNSSLPENPLVHAIGRAWAYGLGILSAYLCVLYFLRTSDVKRKQQTKSVSIGIMVILATGLVTDWLVRLIGVSVPDLTTVAFTVVCVCIAYAMWKYELFAITPTAAAEGIISTMPDALLLVGLDGRIALANQATLKMLGYSDDELVGLSIRDVWADEKDEAELSGVWPDGWTLADSAVAETGFRTKAGTRVPVFVSAAPMRDRDERPQGTIYIGRDITGVKLAEEEKRRMEQQLEMAGRLAAVGELSAGVAHELNNPLAAIQAFAQFLVSREDLEPAVRRDLETIYREAQRAARITGNLLSFARRSRPEKRLMSINDAVEKSVQLYTYCLKASDVDLRMELASDIPPTLADADQMQQVFGNLIKNAEEAIAEGRDHGVLRVSTEHLDGSIRITFADDGPGIPETDLANVFDPFFTTKDVGRGTGLGLSICYGIIQNHGGRIHASNRPGEGAIFVVEIPVVAGEEPVSEEGGLPESSTNAAHG